MAAALHTTLRLAAAVVLAVATSGCGRNPAGSLSSTPARRAVTATAPVAQPVAVVTPMPAATPAQTGTVSIALSALEAEGLTGVGVELTGAGLASPIGKVLTPDELKTSNTLVFEHLPVGALTARVVALGAGEARLAEVSSPVTVTAATEARVALLLTATEGATGRAPVALKFVAPEALEPAQSAPAAETPSTPTPSARPVSPASRALKLEITDKQVIRKLLLLKRLQVTVRVTNDNPTETLNGEVKVEFHKLKGLISKQDVLVETATAPVKALAPGKSIELTLTSTVSAEDAHATVHTVVASASASTREDAGDEE